VLLRLLPQGLDDNIKEGIVRALTVREARGIAAKPLIREFERVESTSQLKWAIANALVEVADENAFEDIARLARDKRHGESRQMLALALGGIKKARASDVLIDLLEDDEVAGHAIIALGKLRVKEARRRIEQFLNHPMPWVRTEAKRALERIDRTSRLTKA
jgi:HEAT repeat protein